MNKREMLFNAQDWLLDMPLRMCSPAARSLWIDMRCWMNQGTPYGHFHAYRMEPGARGWWSFFHMSPEDGLPLLQELLDNKVCLLSDEGQYYCEEMVEYGKTRRIGRIETKTKKRKSS